MLAQPFLLTDIPRRYTFQDFSIGIEFLILDHMSVLGYSSCRIQYAPNNERNPPRNYSDRSLVELRNVKDAEFAIRALDIENNRKVRKFLQSFDFFKLFLRKFLIFVYKIVINTNLACRQICLMKSIWLMALILYGYHLTHVSNSMRHCVRFLMPYFLSIWSRPIHRQTPNFSTIFPFKVSTQKDRVSREKVFLKEQKVLLEEVYLCDEKVLIEKNHQKKSKPLLRIPPFAIRKVISSFHIQHVNEEKFQSSI